MGMLNMQFSVFWLLLLTATVAIDICVGLQLSQNHVYIFYQASLKPVFYVASLLLALVWQMVALISLLLRKDLRRASMPYLVALACVIATLLLINELWIRQLGIWIHANHRNSSLLTWAPMETVGLTIAFVVLPTIGLLLTVLVALPVRWVLRWTRYVDSAA